MSLLTNLMQSPVNLSSASKFAALNGILYMASGFLFLISPGPFKCCFWIRSLSVEKPH